MRRIRAAMMRYLAIDIRLVCALYLCQTITPRGSVALTPHSAADTPSILHVGRFLFRETLTKHEFVLQLSGRGLLSMPCKLSAALNNQRR